MDAQENRIYAAILITAVVLGTVITYFIISILRQQRKNVALHRENILAEITHIEKERARIAHDLHDELGPLLAAVKMKINTLEIHHKEDIEHIEKTNRHIDTIAKRLREISFDLVPNSLLRRGIVPAVKEFISYLNSSTKIKFIFIAPKNLTLSGEIAVNLYRIIQEVIHNTIKHADATEMKIELESKDKMIQLFISDNGIGFDNVKESEKNSGFGLRSLSRRTDIMNGKLYIETEKNKGTRYTFEIPA
jgi:Signal transduction histidine kinase